MKIDFGFPELEELRQIMVADLIPFSIDSRNLREISDISFELNNCGYAVSEIFQPTKSKETQTIEGDVNDIAEQLIDVLKNRLKVIR